MVGNERLDLREEGAWSLENAGIIAKMFGVDVVSQEFIALLAEFLVTVSEANCHQHLGNLFERKLRDTRIRQNGARL